MRPPTRLLWPLCCLLIPWGVIAQNTFVRPLHDQLWLVNGTQIDFGYEPPAISSFPLGDFEFEGTNASICDQAGHLLFYSNNISIRGWDHNPIPEGDTINFNQYWLLRQYYGYTPPQCNIIIPQAEDEYLMTYVERERYMDGDFTPPYYLNERLKIAKLVDQGPSISNIDLQYKDQVILEDTIDAGKLTAVRHGNGRDWWLVIQEWDKAFIYRYLIAQDTIEAYPPQAIGEATPTGLGQAKFSPDGTHYARLNIVSLGGDQYIDIFNFDRCTGEFSNPIQFTYRDTALMGGLAFSPNSRFLYVSSFRFIYQYDLEAADIPASVIRIAEPMLPSSKVYYLAQLAPDGKIYISTQGSSDSLHIIHHPNRRGVACDFEHLGLALTTNSWR
ncbi:MAG: hypothetical protein KDC54_07950, partial [Lewinella sp.]|nr:hypothetical protein [Lewinella sp.]